MYDSFHACMEKVRSTLTACIIIFHLIFQRNAFLTNPIICISLLFHNDQRKMIPKSKYVQSIFLYFITPFNVTYFLSNDLNQLPNLIDQSVGIVSWYDLPSNFAHSTLSPTISPKKTIWLKLIDFAHGVYSHQSTLIAYASHQIIRPMY